MRCSFFELQLLNYFSVDEIARVLIYAFFPFGMEFYFVKCTKQRVFSKVNSVTHPDKIIVCWFILVVLENRDELSGLYLQTRQGAGKEQMEYSGRIGKLQCCHVTSKRRRMLNQFLNS